MVKDERFYDRFDRVFGDYFRGQETLFDEILGEIPLEWLKKQKALNLSPEEKALIESLGGWDKLMEALPEHIALTRSEPGCLVFEVTADNENPGVFRVREEFADREAFQLHQTRMQTSRWGAVSQNVARHYVISEG